MHLANCSLLSPTDYFVNKFIALKYFKVAKEFKVVALTEQFKVYLLTRDEF